MEKYLIHIGMSDGVEMERECEAAGRAGASLALMIVRCRGTERMIRMGISKHIISLKFIY